MALPIRQRPNVETKMLGNDRILKLKQRNPDSKASPGLIGKEVLSGGNNLHAMYDDSQQLWYLKLEHGPVPEKLRQRFTSFSQLYKVTALYFDHKDIDVYEE
jgi:hypothetical protein